MRGSLPVKDQRGKEFRVRNLTKRRRDDLARAAAIVPVTTGRGGADDRNQRDTKPGSPSRPRLRLSKSGSDLRTEFVAGLTTFLTMVYIVFVNPLKNGR